MDPVATAPEPIAMELVAGRRRASRQAPCWPCRRRLQLRRRQQRCWSYPCRWHWPMCRSRCSLLVSPLAFASAPFATLALLSPLALAKKPVAVLALSRAAGVGGVTGGNVAAIVAAGVGCKVRTRCSRLLAPVASAWLPNAMLRLPAPLASALHAARRHWCCSRRWRWRGCRSRRLLLLSPLASCNLCRSRCYCCWRRWRRRSGAGGNVVAQVAARIRNPRRRRYCRCSRRWNWRLAPIAALKLLPPLAFALAPIADVGAQAAAGVGAVAGCRCCELSAPLALA